MAQKTPQLRKHKMSLGLALPGRAGDRVPDDSLAGAAGDIDHVSGSRGVVTDLSRFVTWLTRANGVEEAGEVKDGGVGLVFKDNVLRLRPQTGSLRFLTMVTLIHEGILHRFWPAVDRVAVALRFVLCEFGHRSAEEYGE